MAGGGQGQKHQFEVACGQRRHLETEPWRLEQSRLQIRSQCLDPGCDFGLQASLSLLGAGYSVEAEAAEGCLNHLVFCLSPPWSSPRQSPGAVSFCEEGVRTFG